MSNPVKPQAPMTKNGQPFYPLTTIDQVLDSSGHRLSPDSTIQEYAHSKTNNIHNFVGTGANGRAKITADFADGDIFAVNGNAVTAYWGVDAPDADLISTGRWVTFIVDGDTINFKPGGGLSSTKLAHATATESDVLSGETFYAGDKTLKTGNIQSKAAESVTLNANTTSYTFGTAGKYCTGDMAVSAATKADESVTLNASTTSKTFDTAGKLCTGNMTVSTSTKGAESVTLNASTTGYTFSTAGKLCTGNMTVSTSTKGTESITLNASTTGYTFGTAGKLCTGNMTVSTSTKGAESVTLNASTTGYTFGTSGKMCTGNMTVNTSTKAAESKSFTPSSSAQSYTFATSGKLCTGNMTVSVGAIGTHQLRVYVENNNESNNHAQVWVTVYIDGTMVANREYVDSRNMNGAWVWRTLSFTIY